MLGQVKHICVTCRYCHPLLPAGEVFSDPSWTSLACSSEEAWLDEGYGLVNIAVLEQNSPFIGMTAEVRVCHHASVW